MRIFPAFALVLACAAPAAADTRNFGVSGFDRVRVAGPYKVKLTTGVAPFAKATGSAAALERLAVRVDGRTLIIQSNQSGWGGYPGKDGGAVEITVGTHDLTTAALMGAGGLAINRVKGLEFALT
ncbi:MAG: GIN domain-containing protein, partial [Sphingomicrobium sp.]